MQHLLANRKSSNLVMQAGRNFTLTLSSLSQAKFDASVLAESSNTLSSQSTKLFFYEMGGMVGRGAESEPNILQFNIPL